uniref:hypothetical protein n=1 Tax=Lapillicoccus sp. TaxID=1909287 RepID=UPI003983879D
DADARGFRAELAELVEQWRQGEDGSSVARLLLRELGTGASHGIEFPRELMLLARSLISLEATAALVDPDRTFVNLARDLLPDLKGMTLPSGAQLEQLWKDNRFDYLALALELPEMIPHMRDAIAGGGQGAPSGPGRRPWWSGALTGAGAALTIVAARRLSRRLGDRR